jgi:hypothetical protein
MQTIGENCPSAVTIVNGQGGRCGEIATSPHPQNAPICPPPRQVACLERERGRQPPLTTHHSPLTTHQHYFDDAPPSMSSSAVAKRRPCSACPLVSKWMLSDFWERSSVKSIAAWGGLLYDPRLPRPPDRRREIPASARPPCGPPGTASADCPPACGPRPMRSEASRDAARMRHPGSFCNRSAPSMERKLVLESVREAPARSNLTRGDLRRYRHGGGAATREMPAPIPDSFAGGK